MKKGLILAAALVLVATSALASSVVNSKHNLENAVGMVNPSQEVCVFCHTPHASNTAVTNAPLWNRTLDLAGWDLYNSATLNDNSRPTTVSASIAASDAPLCLSCHDGSTITAGLFNEPNAGAIDASLVTLSAAKDIGAGGVDGTNDLTNDHPIGMDYNAVATTGDDVGGFFDFATASASLQFYEGKMWCSTCHDVHDDANPAFLATTNFGSSLCITCHNK